MSANHAEVAQNTSNSYEEPAIEPYSERLKKLGPNEKFWRDHQKWLEQHGYMLRPRYRPGWTPSWEGTDKRPDKCEDGLRALVSTQRRNTEERCTEFTKKGQTIDAIRLSDRKMVMLKQVSSITNPLEVGIAQYFSEEPLASHPRNHCVQTFEVLDVLDEEGLRILVMPFLRRCNDPPFQTAGECVDFLTQVFEVSPVHYCDVRGP